MNRTQPAITDTFQHTHNTAITDIIEDTKFGDFNMPRTPEELADYLKMFLIK